MILREGENLCLQGDLTHSFYIVKSGALTATSKDEQNGTQILNFGPGSTFGELSLIAGEPMEYTVCAEEDCEIEVVPQSALHDTMKEQPIWLKSILAFLTQRNHIAQENKRKSDLITTFPSLLFVLSRMPAKDISLVALQDEIAQFSKLSALGTYKLLIILQDFKLVRLQSESVSVENKPLIKILYETLRHRAIYKSTSPNILSLTDQAILTAFVKAACDKGELQSDGLVAVNTSDLIEQTKRTMHGMSLTPRNLETLLQKQLLKELPKEKYCANFDKLLNLLELNRIYPLLDKKLITGQ
ncbi:cAMP-binding domain of CRP or a regulatory subunit of cAMP-dependent protein kinases [Fibrobacter sp. UWB16]|uniref:Crp/Fnr family transcriptional regulator n=1 Tax=Fibrobacter sp. UWB16 TaxID=1945874 RepID=UPI000BCD3382|nr:cyclic nucleotide-binding domain-containing protein [Fibrobacter sp. UWB16]SOD13741.1 cAMP-binding domain of CRP or a regulatory subunit of cAMP-dependent protein kinases [Fibrobacter sp. UWB16]